MSVTTIANPNPETIPEIVYDILWCQLGIGPNPFTDIKIAKVPMSSATGKVNHASPNKMTTDCPFLATQELDDDGNPKMPVTFAALEYLKQNADAIFAEFEARKASLAAGSEDSP